MNFSVEEETFPEFENASSGSELAEPSFSEKKEETDFNATFNEQVDEKQDSVELVDKEISIELMSCPESPVKATKINPALIRLSNNHDPSGRRSSTSWKELVNVRPDLQRTSVLLDGRSDRNENSMDIEEDGIPGDMKPMFKRAQSSTQIKAMQFDQAKAYAENSTVQGAYQNIQGNSFSGNMGYGIGKANGYQGTQTLQIRKPLGNFCNVVLAIILCFVSIPLYHLKKDDDTLNYYIFTFLGIAFMCAVSDAWKYFIWSTYPAMEINETGIMDNYTVPVRTGSRPDRFGYGLITWDDIQQVEIWTDAAGACSLVISLKNEEEFKEKITVNGCCGDDDSLVINLDLNKVDLPDNTHLLMNFGKEFDCDVYDAYKRIVQFMELKEFKDKRHPSKHTAEHAI